MVELKTRLEHALGRGVQKAAPAVVNNQNQFSQRQRYPSMGLTKPPTPVMSYYGSQDQHNASNYPQRSTTPAFQNQGWSQPPVNTFKPIPPPTSMPPVPPPVTPAQPAPVPPPQQFPSQQQYPPQQYAPPQFPPQAPAQAAPSAPPSAPPPAAAVPPPPTAAGGISRAGLLSQRSRVYVADPSLSSGRGGYFTPGANAPYPSSNPMGGPQAAQAPGMFQPSFSQQQSGFQGNQFNQPAASFQPPTTHLTNGASYENPAMHPPTFFKPEMNPPQPGSFAQPATFESVPSVTPPPLTAAPAVPVVPAMSAPPGWNDPPPISSVTKPKIEAMPVEPITQPIAQPIQLMGTVEQPAVPLMQPFDGMQNYAVSHAESNQLSSIPEPVQPPPAAPLSPIPSEHVVIHDVLHTLKDKCSNLASNAVNSSTQSNSDPFITCIS